jgi:hypothetical protein
LAGLFWGMISRIIDSTNGRVWFPTLENHTTTLWHQITPP